MFRTTRLLPHPGTLGLSPLTLLRGVPTLLLLAALLTATLTACGGNDEEKRVTATPVAGSDAPAPQLNTPAPTVDETVPGEIETAARKLLADELGVGETDFRLDSSEGVGWSDTSLGCPMPGFMYAQVITPGYKLVFDLVGTSYAVHTNKDGTNAVVCRDDSGVSAPAEDTPTPEAQMERDAESGTQEYAEALEDAFSGRDDEIEDALDDLLGGTLFSSEEAERMESLETAESWSEEDAEFASEFAETILRATADFFDYVLEVTRETLDELSGLRPPDHLSDPHRDYTETYGEIVGLLSAQVDLIKDTDTDIMNREDLADFYALINSFESGSLDPDLEAKGEDLAAQADEACQALKDQLETELVRDVNIFCEAG